MGNPLLFISTLQSQHYSLNTTVSTLQSQHYSLNITVSTLQSQYPSLSISIFLNPLDNNAIDQRCKLRRLTS